MIAWSTPMGVMGRREYPVFGLGPLAVARKASFTSSARYGCRHIAGVNSHRRHIHGTSATHDRPAIYAPYAIYMPPMVSADAAVDARFG